MSSCALCIMGCDSCDPLTPLEISPWVRNPGKVGPVAFNLSEKKQLKPGSSDQADKVDEEELTWDLASSGSSTSHERKN